jgi:hypothetical protein
MRTSINRRQLLIRAGAGALGTAAAAGFAPTVVHGQEQGQDEGVEGGWYISVEVTQPAPATFDALYAFGKGGSFTRIDGRNNAPALGTWKRAEDGAIVFRALLFNFVAGVRTGFIDGKFIAHVVDGTLVGTFTAEGHGIPGFLPRIGTFTGTRIAPEAP